MMAINSQNASDLVLHTALRSLVPVNVLPNEAFNDFARQVHLETASAGSELFHAGDTDQRVVYLLSGEVILRDKQNVPLQNIRGGTDRARYPLAHERPREVTAVAHTDVAYVHIDMHELNNLMTGGHSVDHQLGDIRVSDIHDVHDNDWVTAALQSPLFENLPPANLQVLLAHLIKLPVKQGEVIIKQGETPNYFYYIREGRCEVTRRLKDQDRPIVLAELQEGDGFGEEALIAYGRRNATVTMLTDGVLMRLSNGDFKMLMEKPWLKPVSQHALDGLLAKGAEIIDVRAASAFQESHLPGSRNIPFHRFREQMAMLDPGKTYIMCSDNGRRSAVAAFLLMQRGIDACFINDPELAIHADIPYQETVPETPAPVGDSSAPTMPLLQLEELRQQYEELQEQLRVEQERRASAENDKDALLQQLNEQARLEQQSADEAHRLATETARLRIEKDIVKKELEDYQHESRQEASLIKEESRTLHELEEKRDATLTQIEELRSDILNRRHEAEDLHRRVEFETEQLEIETARLNSVHESRRQEEKDLLELEAKKRELQVVTRQRDDLAQELELLASKLDNSHDELAKLDAEIDKKKRTLENLDRQYADKISSADDEIAQQQAELDAVRQEIADTTRQHEKQRLELEKLSEQLTRNREELDALQENIRNESEVLSKLEEQHTQEDNLVSEKSVMEEKLAALQLQVTTAQQTAEQSNQLLDEKKRQLQDIEARLVDYNERDSRQEHLERELAAVRKELSDTRSKLEETSRTDDEQRLRAELRTIEAKQEAIKVRAEAEQLKYQAEEDAIMLRAEAEKARLKAMEDISRARAEAEQSNLHASSEAQRIREELERLQKDKNKISDKDP